MAIGWQQILLVIIVAALLFGGRGKISSLMGDFASGIKAFRKGLKDEDEESAGDKDRLDKTASGEGPGEAAETTRKAEAAHDA